MKKVFLVATILILAVIGAYAAPGDVVGEIYSTDILAFVNGCPINSYNIGGQTVILAEDLCNNDTGVHYGFDCVYDNATRTLTLASTFTKGNADVTVERGTVGEVVGNVYETDIKVIFNSHEVKGYNIGGQTAICIEDLGVYNESEPNAAFGYSKYLCNAEWNGDAREIKLTSYLQDTNYFGSYPKRKLDISIKDNVISCTFDHLGSYSGNVSYEFSDEFKNNIYVINPVYLDETVVGQVVMQPSGMAAFKMNNREMHLKTSGLEKVLTYGEAVQYIKDNFEVVTEKQLDNASVYLAKKDGSHYLLFAMANGGLVCESKYDSSYRTVELVTNDAGNLCLNLKSDSFSGTMPVSTLGYDFDDSYEKYATVAIPEIQRLTARVGTAVFTVDDAPIVVDAIYDGETFVNIDSVCDILDMGCTMYGGIFYLTKAPSIHKISAQFDFSSAKLPDSVSTMASSDVYVSGALKTFGKAPCYYNGSVYVPAEFFANLFK